ncbi:hypothetical protein K4A76_23305 [Pseudomonas sp. NEEL19]|uniref:zinc-dependent metalloprotease family protein n=1 Tax=Pseudomonas sp. NEEL19 TaxID=2867409 RepID=UPI002368EA5C|nr:zinc-dependent metalloprotease family protein [Pseudomonas sp. NEEL19]WDM59326.1 hypothetical protein K4A76_23305 [Pseudomonas sp. NEEL19]
MKIPYCFALSLGVVFGLQLPDAAAARSLTVTVYIHDDLADMSDTQVRKDYFEHWLNEMRSFSQHPIELDLRRNVERITDIDYESIPASQILKTFEQEVYELPRYGVFSFMDKHLLLTRNPYDRSGLNYVGGLANFRYNTAISSVSAYGAPAHEIGHMLGATHEDAELKFNGWVCETYTYPNRVAARSNCYRYSDKNRAIIADYLKYNSK